MFILFQSVRNNWIRVIDKQLSFIKEGKTYVARWKNIEVLYEGKNHIRLTKITYTAMYSKALQRQSVPFVCQIFHDKTAAALSTVKDKLGLSEGTIIFVQLITDWFHMMNVKDRYSGINMRVECRQPWTKNCITFKKLAETCDVISSCAWSGGRGRRKSSQNQLQRHWCSLHEPTLRLQSGY